MAGERAEGILADALTLLLAKEVRDDESRQT